LEGIDLVKENRKQVVLLGGKISFIGGYNYLWDINHYQSFSPAGL